MRLDHSYKQSAMLATHPAWTGPQARSVHAVGVSHEQVSSDRPFRMSTLRQIEPTERATEEAALH